MSVTPSDFLQSARALAASGTDEMSQRNAVSRAYYAAYHQSCSFISPDKKDRGVGSHKGYIEQLMDHDVGTIERKIGALLSAIYSGRRFADYKLDANIRSGSFGMQIQRVDELFLLTTSPTPPSSSATPAAATSSSSAGAPQLRLRIIK